MRNEGSALYFDIYIAATGCYQESAIFERHARDALGINADDSAYKSPNSQKNILKECVKAANLCP
jgi:hypothetical protein